MLNKVNYNKFLLIFLFIFLYTQNNFSQIKPPDLKIPEPKELPKPNPSAPKIALIPFDFTFDVGGEKAKIALNEIAVSMLKSQGFQPYSLKEWINSNFEDKKSENIIDIVQKVKNYLLPVDFICHGIIFKSGNKYGLQIALYPINSKKTQSYYYRDFTNFYSINIVTDQIIQEMIKRSNSIKKPIFDKNIYIKNFDINFSIYTKSKTGETQASDLPFIKVNGVEYKKDDNFFNELLLYNFHISRTFTVWNNNFKKYVKQNPVIPSGIDYIISGDIDISKKIITIALKVTDNKKWGRRSGQRERKVLFHKKYFIKNVNLNNLYNNMREFTKDIIINLIDIEEQKMIGEIKFDSYYGNDMFFCDDYYLGKGNQENLILPVNTSEI
ncbi:MAG: hypothetical protein KAT05_07250, partial [Spirochaetes bacterium]|nr:hypothetical protein [Spirochaetota bacterium]